MHFLFLLIFVKTLDYDIKIYAGKKHHWLKIVLIHAGLLLLVSLMVIIYRFNPLEHGWYPPCVFHKFTGLYCPGCGSARAIHSLLHGNFMNAADHNFLMVLFTPYILFHFITAYLEKIFNIFFPYYLIPESWLWGIMGLFIFYWIIRNIPSEPFIFFAPTLY